MASGLASAGGGPKVVLPAPKKTGNAVRDADHANYHLMLQEMVESCVGDLDSVPPLYAKFRERQKLMQTQNTDADTTFSDVATFKCLETTFLATLCAEHSDMSVEEIIATKNHEKDAVHQLGSFMTQLPDHMKWTSELHSKEITYRFLQLREQEVGERLKTFKADGGLTPAGKVDWKWGCYRPKFGDVAPFPLEELVHCSGDKVAVEYPMYKAHFKVSHNWSDMTATIVHPPLPDVKCHTFFKDIAGPWTFPQLGKRHVTLKSKVDVVKQEWALAVGAGKTATSAGKLEQEQLASKAESALNASLRTQGSELARTRAKAHLEKNKKRKLASFASDPPVPAAGLLGAANVAPAQKAAGSAGPSAKRKP